MALIKKNWRKDAGENAIDAAARTAGVGLAAYIMHQIQTPEDINNMSNTRNTMIKVGAPVIALVGLAGDLLFDHRVIRAFCQGLTGFGFVRTAANLSKDLAPELGMENAPDFGTTTVQGTSGIGVPAIMNGVGSAPTANPQTTPYIAMPEKTTATAATKVRQQAASEEQSVRGLAEAMLINN